MVNRILVDGGPLAIAVFGDGEKRLAVLQHLHAHHPVALGQCHAAHAPGGTAAGPDVRFVEADRFAHGRSQKDVLGTVGQLYRDQFVALDQVQGNDAAGAWPAEGHQIGLFHRGGTGAHEHVQARLERRHGQDGGHALTVGEVQQVDDGLTAALAADLGDVVDLAPVHLAEIGEKKKIVMRGSHKQMGHVILILGAHGGLAPAAAPLALIQGDGIAFDVAGIGDRDHHVLFGDHVLDGQLAGVGHDLGAPCVAELPLEDVQFVLDDAQHQLLTAQNLLETGDILEDGIVFRDDLVPLQTGESLQTHVQDGLGLNDRQAEGLHEAVLGFLGGFGSADQLDDGVQVVQGDLETFQDVGPGLGLVQVEARPSDNDLLAVQNKMLKDLLQAQYLGPVPHHGQEDHAEAALHLGVFEELIDNHAGHLVFFHGHGDAHAAPVGLVAHEPESLDHLVLHQLGNLLNQSGLVHLIGNLGHHDGFLPGLLVFLHIHHGPHAHDTATGFVGITNALQALNHPTGGKIRAGDKRHQFTAGNLGSVNQGLDALDDFGKIVWRNVGGHAHGDTGRAVDQEGREFGRQDRWFLKRLVVVGDHVDGLFVQVLEHFVGQALHADLGVPHGCCRVTVDGTKVALAIHQGVAHGKILGQAHDGLIDGRIAVGVVLTDHVTDDAGRFLVGFVVIVLELPHGVKHAAMDGFESVAHIGKRPADNHAHGVIQV
ncbi:putative Val start codon [Desulfosarcina cetonica]|nr:putative Val start codon [Desulfosarcina cetonica]